MQISAVDQLVCIADGDSYASAMGAQYPDNAGNAQYFDVDASGNIIKVTPTFADQDGKRLIFFPYLFSAVEGKYLVPSGQCTFRINNKTSNEAIIAQGTVAQFANNGALVNGSGVWGTKLVNGASTNVLRSAVFKTMNVTINDGVAGSITLPALAIIGDLPYGSRNDISIFCTCEMEEGSLMAKGEVEIRQMSETNFKVVITAVNNTGSNDQVINSANETITLTANLLKNGSTAGLSGMTFNWHKFGEAGISLQSGGNYAGSRTGHTLAVTEGMVPGNAIFVCDVTYGGTTYSASININDIQDQYTVNKGRTVYRDSSTPRVEVENSNVIRKQNIVVYTPSVIDKNTGTVSNGWTFGYRLVKNDGTQVSTSSGASLEVSGNTVHTNGGLNVIISATNSNI